MRRQTEPNDLLNATPDLMTFIAQEDDTLFMASLSIYEGPVTKDRKWYISIESFTFGTSTTWEDVWQSHHIELDPTPIRVDHFGTKQVGPRAFQWREMRADDYLIMKTWTRLTEDFFTTRDELLVRDLL